MENLGFDKRSSNDKIETERIKSAAIQHKVKTYENMKTEVAKPVIFGTENKWCEENGIWKIKSLNKISKNEQIKYSEEFDESVKTQELLPLLRFYTQYPRHFLL